VRALNQNQASSGGGKVLRKKMAVCIMRRKSSGEGESGSGTEASQG